MIHTMKTKNILRFFLVMLATVGPVVSCKDYLELKPVSSFGPDYVFSNVDNVTKAVIGAYAPLGGDAGYGIRVSMYYPYDNDEMMGQGATPYPDNERRDIAHYNVQPGNTQLPVPFSQMYVGIERANICIYYIPKMDLYTSGSATIQKQLKRLYGEALTLRAQYYYELIRNWGDVPAQFLPSSFEKDLNIGKTNRDEIYDQIIADLGQAAQLVPWRSEVGSADQRITQGAVRALRARIALFRGGYSLRAASNVMERTSDYKTYYQIARDECDTIIRKGDHALNPSFKSVFKDAIDAHKTEPNGEVLWEVAMTGGSSATGDSKLGYYNGPTWNGNGNGALTILPTFFYTYDSMDTRRDVTCAPYNINADGTLAARTVATIVDGKFRRDWIKGPDAVAAGAEKLQYFGVNWPVIRYSDVLLMFAEADNELNGGPSADAIAAYEKVRLRAFSGDASRIGTTPTSYDDFFNAIINERSWEFCGEGIRKYDLIRWNILAERIKKAKDDLAAMAAGTAPYDKLPTTMYFLNGSTSVVWGNSLYKPTTIPTNPGTYTVVPWVGSSTITTTLLTYYAISFKANHSELLPIASSVLDASPKLGQDYGY